MVNIDKIRKTNNAGYLETVKKFLRETIDALPNPKPHNNTVAIIIKISKTTQQCFNLIKNGPKWIPARHNGKAVSAYKKQPISFVVSEQ